MTINPLFFQIQLICLSERPFIIMEKQMIVLRSFIHQDAELQQKLCRKTAFPLKYRHAPGCLHLQTVGQDSKSVNVFYCCLLWFAQYIHPNLIYF